MASPRHILVLRFSAMGDVALLTPVVHSFRAAYPLDRVTVVSRPKFAAFFPQKENLRFFAADVDTVFSGGWGIVQLFAQLRKLKPDVVLDVHDHLRSRILCFLFRLIGTKIIRFQKGRGDKKLITRSKNKIRKELPHTVDRYREAFSKAGFNFSIGKPPYWEPAQEAEKEVNDWLTKNELVKNGYWFGLAPFAAHKTKIWPVENYFQLIKGVLEKTNALFFLFGGGENEISFFRSLKSEFPDACRIVAGELKLVQEIALMKKLDKMICVDSSNMHLAALASTPTITIWGGTHPSTGFGSYGNRNVNVETDVDKLPCRPCSVYGKEVCRRGDFACLREITPDEVLSRLF